MANLRNRKLLTCFYCGKRSSTRYDGFIREFLCLHCDATNYLDERGEITDPPVAKTTSAPAPTTYAIPRSQSPEFLSPSQSIFCATCLKNQHLFTSSLAQYLPEDPDHPEYAELEKNMYKFRRRLEQRYPQICAECEPKVHAQLDQAGYTARTDHLRRMMDRSRRTRVVPKQVTPLDVTASVGRWLWLGGIVCQYLWHLSALAAVFSHHDEGPMRDPDAETTWIQRISLALTLLLPSPGRLIHWSLLANALSVWWNPKFAQVFRGFSRHIIGLGQWYTFQGLIIFTRFMAMKMAEVKGGRSAEEGARLSLHGFMALLMMVIYILAKRSVRIDTTPLFQVSTTPASSPPRALQSQPKENDTKNMSNLLDDILAESSPQSRIPPSPTSVGSGSPALFQRQLQYRTSNHNIRPGTPEPPQHQPSVHYSEEMDWSPTQSKHRAFNSFGPPKAPNQIFGQPDSGPNSSPFWYKVPPAPIAPAQKLRNGPKPLLTKTAERKSIFATSSMNASKSDASVDEQPGSRAVAFAQPQFFAPSATNSNDPRNSLADLLNTSFSLSQDDLDEAEHEARTAKETSAQAAASGALARAAGLRNNRLLDAFTLAILLAAWFHATSASYPYSRDVMLGAMAFCMVIAIHLTGDAIKDMRNESTLSWASIINTSLGIGELAVACHFALQIWDSRMESVTSSLQGASVIGAMLVHEMWNAAC